MCVYCRTAAEANLSAAKRQEALQKFAPSGFKKVAIVILGEPNAEYKARVQQLILAEKRVAAEAGAKLAMEDERRRIGEERRKAEDAQSNDGAQGEENEYESGATEKREEMADATAKEGDTWGSELPWRLKSRRFWLCRYAAIFLRTPPSGARPTRDISAEWSEAERCQAWGGACRRDSTTLAAVVRRSGVTGAEQLLSYIVFRPRRGPTTIRPDAVANPPPLPARSCA